MSGITLDASTRSNLLSLQATTDLLNRTSNRLSTGLKVANPINNTTQNLTIDFNADFGLNTLTFLSVNAISNNASGLGLSTFAHGAFFTVTTTINSQPSAASLQSVASHQSVPSFASRPALV